MSILQVGATSLVIIFVASSFLAPSMCLIPGMGRKRLMPPFKSIASYFSWPIDQYLSKKFSSEGAISRSAIKLETYFFF